MNLVPSSEIIISMLFPVTTRITSFLTLSPSTPSTYHTSEPRDTKGIALCNIQYKSCKVIAYLLIRNKH